jgi:hypothetical protein
MGPFEQTMPAKPLYAIANEVDGDWDETDCESDSEDEGGDQRDDEAETFVRVSLASLNATIHGRETSIRQQQYASGYQKKLNVVQDDLMNGSMHTAATEWSEDSQHSSSADSLLLGASVRFPAHHPVTSIHTYDKVTQAERRQCYYNEQELEAFRDSFVKEERLKLRQRFRVTARSQYRRPEQIPMVKTMV